MLRREIKFIFPVNTFCTVGRSQNGATSGSGKFYYRTYGKHFWFGRKLYTNSSKEKFSVRTIFPYFTFKQSRKLKMFYPFYDLQFTSLCVHLFLETAV